MRKSLVVLLVLSGTGWAEDWPHWRGPTGMGHSSAKDLPLTWGGKENENVRWKSPLLAIDDKVRLDNNQSSPIVAKGHVYVQMSYWPSTSTTKEFPEHHVIAFDAADGKRLWDTKVPPGPWLLSDLRGGYTAPTPASDGERVYALFGSAVLAALDRKGEIVWRKEIKPHAFDVAIGTSPVLYKDTVLVLCAMTKNSRLLAFDKATGETRWTQELKNADWTHTTPAIAPVAGKEQLLVAAAYALQGLDPATGELIWQCGLEPKTRTGDAPTPALGAGLVYVDSGRGGPGLAVDPTGTGDVSKTHVKWKNPNVPGDSLGSPLIVGEYLYRLHSPGVMKCYKLPGGEVMYSERLQDVTSASSPVATADGRIYLASGNRSYVLRAGPTFEVLGTGTLGDGNNSSPAVAENRLLIRGQKNLYCIGK